MNNVIVLLLFFIQYIIVESFLIQSKSYISTIILNSDSNSNSNSNSGKSWSPKQENNNNRKNGEWQSGYIFSKNNSRPPGGKRRNDPWWMREEEKDNPRMLPQYKPWWFKNDLKFDDMKVAQLREEATLAGLVSSGLKADLIQRLTESKKRFSLTDEAFTEPIFKQTDKSLLPTCYPDIYEPESEIKRLRLSDAKVAPPSQ